MNVFSNISLATIITPAGETRSSMARCEMVTMPVWTLAARKGAS